MLIIIINNGKYIQRYYENDSSIQSRSNDIRHIDNIKRNKSQKLFVLTKKIS